MAAGTVVNDLGKPWMGRINCKSFNFLKTGSVLWELAEWQWVPIPPTFTVVL
jgi:hypothetical protein